MLLIEYQYNLPTFGTRLKAGLSTLRDRPFRVVTNTRLLILKAHSCGPSPRKHNLKYHPRPTRSPGSFGGQRTPWYRKSSGFKTFLGSAVTSFFPRAPCHAVFRELNSKRDTVAFAYCSRLSCFACVLSLHEVTGPSSMDFLWPSHF